MMVSDPRKADEGPAMSAETLPPASGEVLLGGTSEADPERAVPARKSVLREYAEAIIIAMVLAFAIRVFFVQAFKIPSGSMEETLLIGDHILVNKMAFGLQWPGDCQLKFSFPPVT